MMESVQIKQEIKEEPLDPDDFNPALIPKVEVNEADDNELLPDKSLSCPKCDITYYSAMSIKNHIQVCKKSKVHNVPLTNLPRVTIKGVKKLKEDERRSIRILEQSFFVNEKAAIDDEIKMDPEGSHMGSHFCEECEISFDITSHFARHLYAHTFIKIEEDDMPCICADCGFDFIDRHHLKLHLEQYQCSGSSKVLFPCHLCKKVFTRKDNLRDDLRSHINLERRRALQKRQYKCKKCSNEYGGQTILQIHIKSHRKRLANMENNSTNTTSNNHANKKIKVEIKEEPLDDEILIKQEPPDY